MSNGRAAFLLRWLSSGENKIKNVNLNSSCIDHPIVNPACGHRDFGQRKRLSSFSSSPTCVKALPKLTRSLSDNFVKMSSNIEANIKVKPKHTNRLSNEKSPYLLQHAHNPVDWYPWCTEAINRAKAENKLIFLSIGYSTCHWCHVMEKESFESEDVAKVMNENYINIKVDREERPDIDHMYMLFVMATTGGGGWPMSVFLTPDLQPVTGGTYFPPEDRWGKPGFKSILLSLASKWKQNHAEFIKTASNVMEALHMIAKVNDEDSTPIPGERAWTKCIKSYKQTYDPVFGGFGNAPKFPHASVFNFLFHFYARDKTNSDAALCLEMCLHSLSKIANGGIHDHISSGFSRYSVDGEWHVPHFEKMLYDQAQLTSVYTDAYLASKDEFFANVVRDIIKYVNRDLRHESGGYYSAEDADSYPTFDSTEKKEGAFYVWPYSEIKSLLEDKEYKSVKHLDLFCYHFNIESLGNIAPESDPHNELKFKNVLIVYGSNEDTMRKFELTKEDFDIILKECVDTLYEAQQKRPRPHLDTKMLCSWNALMIAGLAHAGQGLGDYSYVEDAIKAAKFVKEHLYDDSTKCLLHSCYRADDGTVAQMSNPIQGFLDDYAFLIKGLLNLYEASLDLQWLSWAQQLQKTQDELFWDKENGGYFLSSDDDDTVVMRLKEDSDGAEPSGNSVSCHNLLRLAAYGDKSVSPEGGEHEREMAKKILTVFAKKLTENGLALPEMMSALMFYTDSPTQVLISGRCSDPRTLELVRVVRSRLLPGRVLAVADPADAAPAGTSDILLSRIRPCGDTPAAYVCRRYACSLPVTDVKQLESLLDEPALPVSSK